MRQGVPSQPVRPVHAALGLPGRVKSLNVRHHVQPGPDAFPREMSLGAHFHRFFGQVETDALTAVTRDTTIL